MTDENNTAEMIKKVFLEEANKDFRFLTDDYGFHQSKSKHWYTLEYLSSKVIFRVYNDPRCHELSVAIGLKNDKNKRRYGQHVVLETIFGEGHNRDLGAPPDNIDGIRNQIKHLAKLVRDNYEPFLKGDAELYRNLELTELKMGERGMRQYRQEVRNRAEKAFQSGDFAMALSLYESISEYLEEGESERLRQIRKQIRTE